MEKSEAAFKLEGDTVTIDLKSFDSVVKVHGIHKVLPDLFKAIGEEVAIRRLVASGMTFETASELVGFRRCATLNAPARTN